MVFTVAGLIPIQEMNAEKLNEAEVKENRNCTRGPVTHVNKIGEISALQGLLTKDDMGFFQP